jgi:hypothetical protein
MRTALLTTILYLPFGGLNVVDAFPRIAKGLASEYQAQSFPAARQRGRNGTKSVVTTVGCT